MRGKSREQIQNDLRKAESTAFSIIHLLKEYNLMMTHFEKQTTLDMKIQRDSIREQLSTLARYLKDI